MTNSRASVKLDKSYRAMFLYYFILIVALLIILIPLLWTLSTSFDKINSNALPSPPRLFPKNFTLMNYQIALNNVEMIKSSANTLFIALVSVVLNTIVASMAGFALSKGRFPFRNIILIFILSNLMVPFESKMVETYSIIHSLNLVNTYAGLLLPSIMTNAFYIFLVKKAFDDIPDSLFEAAQIDGASPFRIYLQIFLPLIGAIIGTIAVLDSLAVWNDLLWPLLIVNSSSKYTVQMAMYAYSTKHPGVISAISMLSIVPLALIFTFAQKYIVQSVVVSGIKS